MARTRGASISANEGPDAKKAKPGAASSNATGSKGSAAKKPLKVGDKIPNVSLEDEAGNPVDVASIKGIVALFAYPKAKTPGCTRQTRGFGEIHDGFSKLNATVYGLSADSVKAQLGFRESLDLPFGLLSDPDYKLLGPLGAKKSPKGVIRSHWVIKDGTLVFAENQVKPDASPSIVLKAAQEAAGAGSLPEADEKDEPEPGTEQETPAEEHDQEEQQEQGPELTEKSEPKLESNGHANGNSNGNSTGSSDGASTNGTSATSDTSDTNGVNGANGSESLEKTEPTVEEPKESEEPEESKIGGPTAVSVEPDAPADPVQPTVVEP